MRRYHYVSGLQYHMPPGRAASVLLMCLLVFPCCLGHKRKEHKDERFGPWLDQTSGVLHISSLASGIATNINAMLRIIADLTRLALSIASHDCYSTSWFLCALLLSADLSRKSHFYCMCWCMVGRLPLHKGGST